MFGHLHQYLRLHISLEIATLLPLVNSRLTWLELLARVTRLQPLLEERDTLGNEITEERSARELIRRVGLPNEERMESDKSKEHNRDDAAKEYHDSKHLILFLQVLSHDFPVRFELLALLIHECLVPQVALIDQMKSTEAADYAAIDADTSVHNKEEHKILVVVEANAVVEPDTMMIELLTAHVAKSAVLAASGLRSFARVTPTRSSEHDIVIVIPFYGAFDLSFVGGFLDVAGIGVARQVVGVVAEGHERPGYVLVVVVDVRVGNVLEAIPDIAKVAADRQEEVHELDCGIGLVANVGLGAFHEPNDVFTTWSLSYQRLERDRDGLVEETLGLRLWALPFDVYEDKAVEE